jgi:hypothetical protein
MLEARCRILEAYNSFLDTGRLLPSSSHQYLVDRIANPESDLFIHGIFCSHFTFMRKPEMFEATPLIRKSSSKVN